MISFEELNSAQKEAVSQVDGPVMVLAGAGSGKTRTLVARIQHLVGSLGVPAHRILALTFSNKAAREMRDRVAKDSPSQARDLQLTTFHSFCARLLRSEFEHLGLGRNFTIYDDGETRTLVKNLLKTHRISPKEISPPTILHYIDGLKNQAHYPGQPEREFLKREAAIDTQDFYYQLYQEYEKELARSNAVDFGGLIVGVIKLFEKFPQVRERIQKQYRYLLIDEYQDTNRAQFMLMHYLAGQHKNVCVVGDEDQSIYSWRGADIHNILDFEHLYPDTKLIKLEQNYRSSQTIIEAAKALIAHNQMRKGKAIWTDNPDGEKIELIACKDDRQEASFIPAQIQSLVSTDSASLNEMAVFYRNNSQSRAIEDALRGARIPYIVVGGIKFYDRKEIKDVLCYLRVVINPADSLALIRIINIPARGLGATSLRKIEEWSVTQNCSIWDSLKVLASGEKIPDLRISSKSLKAVTEFVEVLQTAMADFAANHWPSTIYEKLVQESGYLEALEKDKSYEAQARLENLQEFHNGLKEFERETESPNLANFLELITLDANRNDSQNNEGDYGEGVLSLMTIHGSKGLEYPYVFLVGTEEGIFPSHRSLESGEVALEEERRLFYVAMTRAMKRLWICYARARMLWGNLKFNGPSRFLSEIPEELCHTRVLSNPQEMNYKRAPSRPQLKLVEDDNFSESQAGHFDDLEYVMDEPETSYARGEKIRHQLYGQGTVVKCEGHMADEKVLIEFGDGLRRKFMVRFAPIERI